MHQLNQGFTIIELLITIATITVLAAVLIPGLMQTRSKSTDSAAQIVANRVLNALVAAESANTESDGQDSTCSFTTEGVTVISGAITHTVNTSGPISSVSCESTASLFTVSVSYVGGNTGLSPIVVSARKR